jgi:hypothetical protein
VDRRSRPKPNGRVQVINTQSSGSAVGIGNTRFHADSVTDSQILHLLADFDERSGGFVPQNHRSVHYERSDLPILVIVNVAATDPDRFDLDPDIVWTEFNWQLNLSEIELALTL